MRAARLRKKPASTSTAANVRLLCRKKEKPRGSASSESVRAGLLPRADLLEIIGVVFATVNVEPNPYANAGANQIGARLSEMGREDQFKH